MWSDVFLLVSFSMKTSPFLKHRSTFLLFFFFWQAGAFFYLLVFISVYILCLTLGLGLNILNFQAFKGFFLSV